jgi:hypothetical protein
MPGQNWDTFAELRANCRWDLEKWITSASSQPLLQPFADGTRHDQTASLLAYAERSQHQYRSGHSARILPRSP